VWGDPISDAAGNVTHIATITFQADMAGSIIGKAGANVKQIQISSGAKVSVGYGFLCVFAAYMFVGQVYSPLQEGQFVRVELYPDFRNVGPVQACERIAKRHLFQEHLKSR
jgi:hypothetical protein